jgi:hypothetical protein
MSHDIDDSTGTTRNGLRRRCALARVSGETPAGAIHRRLEACRQIGLDDSDGAGAVPI